MKTIKVYTATKLKEKFPDAFKKAFEKFQQSTWDDEIPWNGEIIDSFKAIFEHSNMRLKDYELDTSNPSNSAVKFFFAGEETTEDLQGNRALAWIENNLLSGLREKKPFIQRIKNYSNKWYDFTKYGEIPSCPFTGVCFDEDFIESLLKSVKSGDTLKEAYENLASVASKLMQSEIEYQSSEENFLEQDFEFTKDGTRI